MPKRLPTTKGTSSSLTRPMRPTRSRFFFFFFSSRHREGGGACGVWLITEFIKELSP